MKTILIRNIPVPVEQAFSDGLENCLRSEINKVLGTSEFEYTGLQSKSIDARRKGNIKHILAARVRIDKSHDISGLKNCSLFSPNENPEIILGSKTLQNPPIVVGSGPSGLFCAYLLAKHGFAPIVIERGEDLDSRKKSVQKLWSDNILNPESNVQFGEGGAGTFSDGKLVTRINDPRCKYIIDAFLEKGAPQDIAYEARPHIGTDILVPVIKGIREEIKALGGKFLYNSKLTDIAVNEGISSIRINDEYEIQTDVLILAIGHSARDTYEMLFNRGVQMQQKPFSAGVRIEHLQSDVNFAQWGEQARFLKGAADYSLHTRLGGRAAYTFCMCPGGIVVNASSEEGSLAVNGMSYHDRKGKNANSAWVAEVLPGDLDSSHPLAGIEFQRMIEKKCYISGGGNFNAPVQLLGDFIRGEETKSFYRVKPTYTGNTNFSDINQVIPSFISDTLKSSVKNFKDKMKCFANNDALLTGCETRTSSPVRINRNPEYESLSHKGIYPAGEGAGYAGGIMSAAVDGLKVAESIIKLYNYNG